MHEGLLMHEGLSYKNKEIENTESKGMEYRGIGSGGKNNNETRIDWGSSPHAATAASYGSSKKELQLHDDKNDDDNDDGKY